MTLIKNIMKKNLTYYKLFRILLLDDNLIGVKDELDIEG